MRDAKTLLTVDSSSSSAGAVLSQVLEGLKRPLAFFSKIFSSVHRTYSAFNRELLGAYLAVKHFKYFPEGREFSLVTDHKSLVSAIRARMHDATAMQSRYLAYISEFTTDVQYIPGSENVVADCLSKPHAELNVIYEESNDIDLSEIAIEQMSDYSILNLLDGVHFLKIVKRSASSNSNVMILGDCSTGHFRPLVPQLYRRNVFDVLRGLFHPGIKGTQKLFGSRFVWPRMKVDIRDMVRACIACQQSKVSKYNRAPLRKFKAPDARFESIHVDLAAQMAEWYGASVS